MSGHTAECMACPACYLGESVARYRAAMQAEQAGEFLEMYRHVEFAKCAADVAAALTIDRMSILSEIYAGDDSGAPL